MTLNISRLRKQLGETQEQFAKRFGVRQSTVHRWETGDLKPSGPCLILLRQLATAMKSGAKLIQAAE